MQANLIAFTLLDTYHSEYLTLSDAAGSIRFPVGYRRGSPSDVVGNESFLVEQPRAPSDYRRTYTFNAARAEPPSDAA